MNQPPTLDYTLNCEEPENLHIDKDRVGMGSRSSQS